MLTLIRAGSRQQAFRRRQWRAWTGLGRQFQDFPMTNGRHSRYLIILIHPIRLPEPIDHRYQPRHRTFLACPPPMMSSTRNVTIKQLVEKTAHGGCRSR
jgi:hypothetical protein